MLKYFIKARLLFSVFLSLLIPFFMVGCSDSNEASNESSSKPAITSKTIKIGIDVFPGWGHAFIAQEKGFFKEEGVNVELVPIPDYLQVMDAYTSGKVDGAFLVLADAIVVNDQGKSTKVPYISDHSISGDILFSSKDITDVSQLAGKTIGVEAINSFSHLFVLSILESHGIAESAVDFKSINAQELVTEIESGNVDAGHTYGPGKSAAQAKGFVALAKSGDAKGIITDALAMDATFVDQNPEAVKAIVAALFRAKEYQAANEGEAIEIIAKHNNDTPESVREGIKAVEYVSLASTVAGMKTNPPGELHTFGQKIGDFYFNRGEIQNLPDLETLLYSDAVAKLK